ncbi:MAG: iron ABC transporter permease [Turneriella sp.]|nr:iron ABC transporter permease [Turneriella sp.]
MNVGFTQRSEMETPLKFTLLFSVLLVCFYAALSLGASRNVAPTNFFTLTEIERTILLEIRLPRVLFAAVAGAGLALSGVITQSLFRNPLAEPFLLGTSAGAMLFAIFGIFAASRFGLSLNVPLLAGLGPALFAFVGATLAFALVQFWGKSNTGSVQYILLAGIATNAIASAASGIFIYLANDRELRDITFWSLGSFGAVNYPALLLAAIATTIALSASLPMHRKLDALLLGDEAAFDIGLSVKTSRTIFFLLVVLCQGVLVSLCGIIPFIALIAPHIARMLFGSTHRRLLPASVLVGAIIALSADTMARKIAQPAEVPLGILTGLMGAPFFLYILRQYKMRAI